jgi:hypothetical protein
MSGTTVTTDEGRRLVLDRVRVRRLLTRFGRSVLRDMLRSAGEPRTVIYRRTGQRFLLFSGRSDARRFWIFTRPVGGGDARVVAIRELQPESEGEGYWHREWQQQLVNQLGYRHGLTPVWSGDRTGAPGVVRDSMPQIVGSTAHGDNKPDHSYVAADGRRVNVEIDTHPDNSAYHMRNLTRRDLGGVHVGIMLNADGTAKATYVYDPATKKTMKYDGLASLPAPQNAAGHATRLDPLPPGTSRAPAGKPIEFHFTGIPGSGGVEVTPRALDTSARRAPLQQERTRRQVMRKQLAHAGARGGAARAPRGGSATRGGVRGGGRSREFEFEFEGDPSWPTEL